MLRSCLELILFTDLCRAGIYTKNLFGIDPVYGFMHKPMSSQFYLPGKQVPQIRCVRTVVLSSLVSGSFHDILRNTPDKVEGHALLAGRLKIPGTVHGDSRATKLPFRSAR